MTPREDDAVTPRAGDAVTEARSIAAMPTSRAPTLGVVIPATDAPPFVARCLHSIEGATDPPDQIVVVDEESMTVVEARNAGARRIAADVVVFVDSDVLVHRDAFTQLRERLTSSQASAVIGVYDDEPAAEGVVSGFRNLLHHHMFRSAPAEIGVFWTGLGAVRREVFESIGGFDDDLRWPRRSRDRRDFMADVSFGIRLAEAGHRIVVDPGIQCTHLKHWTLRQMIYTDFLLRGVPWVRLLLDHRRMPGYLNLAWRHRISALLSLLQVSALARRRLRAMAAATAAMVAVNRRFYALLLRRRGGVQAAAGVACHVIHHLVSIASVLAGIGIHLSERSGSRSDAAPGAGEEQVHTAEPEPELVHVALG